MAQPLSGKDKAARVPLGYYEKTGSARRHWAWWVFGALAVLAVTAGVFGFWKQAASPGPVHSSHAAWENDCSQCHKPLRPTGTSNPLGSRGKAADELCQRCHMGHKEQAHHPGREIESEVGSCASCHLEHRGRNAFLSRVADARCTCCHANLD
jgi:hypothetical protein